MKWFFRCLANAIAFFGFIALSSDFFARWDRFDSVDGSSRHAPSFLVIGVPFALALFIWCATFETLPISRRYALAALGAVVTWVAVPSSLALAGLLVFGPGPAR